MQSRYKLSAPFTPLSLCYLELGSTSSSWDLVIATMIYVLFFSLDLRCETIGLCVCVCEREGGGERGGEGGGGEER